MEYQLLIAGFLLGMLIGVLVMNRIHDKHSKEMKKIDDDFEGWKVRRHKQFIAELDEIDSKSHEYWRDLADRKFGPIEHVDNPNIIDPLTHINNRR